MSATIRYLFAEAWDELRSLTRRHHLVRGLVTANLHVTHTDTVLGLGWWMLSPLLEAAVYFFLVGVVFQSRRSDLPLFILSAIVPWKCFTEGCSRSMTVFAARGKLMRQVRFPRSAIVVAWVLSAHLNAVFALPVLIGMQVWFGTGPSVHLAAVFALLLPQLLLAVGLSLMLTAVNVHFRDLERLSGFFFRLWFILSPALYDASMVPERYRGYFLLNPFARIFSGMRDVFMHQTVPPLGDVVYLSVLAAVFLLVGFIMFGSQRRKMTRLLR